MARRTFAVYAAAFAVAGCGTSTTAPNRPAGPAFSEDASAAVSSDSTWVVFLKPSSEPIDAAAARLVGRANGHLRQLFRYGRIHGFSAKISPDAVAGLRKDPSVESVGPNVRVHALTTENSAPWHLDRIDQYLPPLDNAYHYVSTGAGVNLYIIDTPIRTSHTDFGGRARIVFASTSNDTLSSVSHDHGTRVASVAAGTMYGVAKSAHIYSVAVMDGINDRIDDLIAGLTWLEANHVAPAVANLSIGACNGGSAGSGGGGGVEPQTGACKDTVNSQLDATVRSLISAGVTVVVAAGNQAGDACKMSPADVSTAIVVGATTQVDAIWPLSNTGSCVDLFAPGATITSAVGDATNTSVDTASGTSLAAPVVAGIVARYLQNNPAASPATIQQAAVSHATLGVQTGLVKSPNLLAYGNFADTARARLTVTPQNPSNARLLISTAGTYTWTSTVTGGTGPYRYQWYIDYNGSGNFELGGVAAAQPLQITCNNDPSVTLRLTVVSSDGLEGSAQTAVTVRVPPPCGG